MFSMCPTLLRSMDENPVMRAMGSISSTVTGS